MPAELIRDPEAWVALVTLTMLEVVLGIDNIIFISILAGKLPHAQQQRARTTGLAVAMLSRLALLFSLTWIMRLTAPLFAIAGRDISGRDLILIAGGLFLLAKSTHEIHLRLEGDEGQARGGSATSFGSVVLQVLLLDVVFSLDSVITAIGMVDEIAIMVAAVVAAVAMMMLFAGAVAAFVHRHPTVKMLALSFLLMIGVALVAEGLGQHIPKGYIYFAMAFSLMVEMLNQRVGAALRAGEQARR
jgi:predicted tellurium resistance membrane protein TerC